MSSLRRTLLLYLLGAIVVMFAIGGFATYRAARQEIDALMDYHLRQFALSLRDQSFGPPSAPPLTPPEEAFDFVIQIWDSEGVRLYLSHPHSVLPALAQYGYTTVATSEGDWRVFSIPLQDRVIQIAQPMAVSSKAAAVAPCRRPMVFSRLSSGSSSITIRPGSTTDIRKPISLAIGGGGRRPSRIAYIVSIPDMPAAALEIGPGACQSTTRSRRLAGENRSTVSTALMNSSFSYDMYHLMTSGARRNACSVP